MWMDMLLVAGVAFTVIAFSLSTIIPLRIFAIAGNAVSISYGWLMHDHLLFYEGCILLPLNLWRLTEMLLLIKRTRESAGAELSMDWIAPYGKSMRMKAGDVVFHKDDEAQDMFYIEKGRFQLIESGIKLGPHAIVGELGLFTPGQRRTQGLTCVEAGKLLRISYRQLMELYYQNPKFGFYLLKLISQRLLENAGRAAGQEN